VPVLIKPLSNNNQIIPSEKRFKFMKIEEVTNFEKFSKSKDFTKYLNDMEIDEIRHLEFKNYFDIKNQ